MNKKVLYAVALLLFLGAPFALYPVFLMKVLCFALFACAFNLLIGYTGLLSFGHAAFFGGAGYIAGFALKSLGLPTELLRSRAPKSVTAPVAMGIAEQIGGIPALAAVFAVLTGLVGAVSAKYLFDALRVDAPEVRGFAIGSIAHGIGAARAMQVHPDAGAYAGLALSLQVVLASLLLPLMFKLF